MHLKITRQPGGVIDGIALDQFQVGSVYDVGSQIGGLLLAERWAEPVDDGYLALVTPSIDLQQFTERSRGKIGRSPRVDVNECSRAISALIECRALASDPTGRSRQIPFMAIIVWYSRSVLIPRSSEHRAYRGSSAGWRTDPRGSMSQRLAAHALRILVVDDFPDGRELVAEYLTFRGFTVHVARDGAGAIDMARKVNPDIVLMDLSMPGIDGWQATRVLKGDPRTHGMTVIAVTAHALRRETDAARAAGCDGVISKPFDLAALADALPRVLKQGVKALDVPGLSLTAFVTKGWKGQRHSGKRSRPREGNKPPNPNS